MCWLCFYMLTRKFLGDCMYNMKHPYLVKLDLIWLCKELQNFNSLSLSLTLIKFLLFSLCAPLSYSLRSTCVARQYCKAPCLHLYIYLNDTVQSDFFPIRKTKISRIVTMGWLKFYSSLLNSNALRVNFRMCFYHFYLEFFPFR